MRSSHRYRVRKTVRKALRHLGIDMIRWRPQSSPEAALAKALTHHRVDLVLDVGANEGQWGLRLRELGFRGRIISFEPLATPHERLRAAAAMDPHWTVPPRTAIGDREGQVQMYVASNEGASSSIFPMLAGHTLAAPDVEFVGAETVPISRLDRVAEKFVSGTKNVFLKVDVQGYELQVLEGATRILPIIGGVEVEVSFAPLYDGQPSVLAVTEWMNSRGFDVWGIIPGFANNSTGQLLQADIVFFRS